MAFISYFILQFKEIRNTQVSLLYWFYFDMCVVVLYTRLSVDIVPDW